MKLALRELPPLTFRALTMTGGAVLLFVWYRLRGIPLQLPRTALAQVLLLALPNILGWHALSIFGVQSLASGRAAIVGFTMPVWTVLMGVLFFGERMSPRLWLATLSTATALMLLMWHELGRLSGNPAGLAWMLAAALSWAIGTLLLKRIPAAVPTEVMTVWMIGATVPVMWALALLMEPPLGRWPSGAGWATLAYGALINYGVAQILWFSIARSLPPVASALSIMLIPIVGLLSAVPITQELPYPEDFLAAGMIALALAVTLMPGKSR
ncbi:MAG: EamA family transporter [Rhodocyclaceae bacterium]|nr:EamA family transporter [Rhodocyclaceae bacterium]